MIGFKAVRYVLVLLLALPAIGASKQIPWETGFTVSQEFGSGNVGTYAAAVGPAATITMPVRRSWNLVTVDVGQYRYNLLEDAKSGFLVFVVNDTCRFYRDLDGFAFVFLDQHGKRHKFSITGVLRK